MIWYRNVGTQMVRRRTQLNERHNTWQLGQSHVQVANLYLEPCQGQRLTISTST